MKTYKNIIVLMLFSFLAFACEVEDGENLNGPTTDAVSEDLSRGELQEAIGGALSDMRVRLGTQVDAMSVAGREYWRFQSSDPRWTADLLTGTLDNNTFYTTNPYAARYAAIKDINILLEGLANTTADFSDQEIAAIRGFANTIKAHELLMVLNHQFQNGIRIDVNDPDNLGPFVNYDDSLTAIFQMLTEAVSDLSNGGDVFPFSIPSGFAIASTPASFIEFNNALAARVEIYRGNLSSASTLLQNSFMNMNGDLDNGVYFTFSLSGADLANPLFFALNSTGANARIAHPTFVDDARPNDTRVNKAVLRNESITQSDLTGTHDVFVYGSQEASAAIIRNEELLLLFAEANHISNPTAAIEALDVIRINAGLGAYSGGNSPAELVDEIIYNRRYSLFAEGGHRWIDVRRFGILNTLPIDRAGDAIFDQFPIPLTENQ
ncbi:RagB/SusD family nutrient uptake outer membrane protein [uncultured Dokdonia sp.]|uniref:RagB/SusD family nutrient uptake outer membrane protein n=1 Tax=uncultured Dokdonia sp. TaxID=575653 RepID=UPI0026390D74|nr:RagB/SusD family nutrient uptake outer membrane protein [uncultured Dokdonia sp.]